MQSRDCSRCYLLNLEQKLLRAAAIGSLFTIQFPDDWLEHEKYDFDWSILTKEAVRFSKFDYNAI